VTWMETVEVGESPTIKKYINEGLVRKILEEAATGSIPVSNSLSMTMDDCDQDSLAPPSQVVDLVFKSSTIRLPLTRFYAARVQSSTCNITVEGFRDNALNTGYIHLILEKPGFTIIRINGDRGHSAIRLYVRVMEAVEHEVLLLGESGRNSVSLYNLDAELDKSAKLVFTALFKPGLLAYARISSTLRDGATLLKNILVDATAGSHIEVEDSSDLTGSDSSVEAYMRARLEGGSVAALRGRGVASEYAYGSRVVYGTESLIGDAGSYAYMHPYLEIKTSRIREARHYARNQVLSGDRIFYMETRGLSPAEARYILVRGFMTQGLSDLAKKIVSEAISS